MNVNFPAGTVKGVRVAEQGFRDYGNINIVGRTDPRGFPYFWFGYGREVETPRHATDLEAVRGGWVSVTPLHLDLTHYPTMASLREAMAGLE